MPNEDRLNTRSSNGAVIAVLVVVAILYFAKVVLIPLALAVLFAFMLAPLVARLRHLGLGRILSGVLVISTAFVAVGITTALMVVQFADLAKSFPEYQQNVQEKVDTIRSSGGGFVSRVSRFAQSITKELTPATPTPTPARPGEQAPVPVEIRAAPFSPIGIVHKILGSLLEIAVVTGVVVVFVVFILIERDDLRDRVVRLVGSDNITVTTQVLDDAADRVSRFLLAQLILNTGYGALAALGLYFIGVPNPILWGILAVLLRYIPYLGIWIAAILPAGLAFAVEPGWTDVFLVFGLYFGLDLFLYNLAEPLLYGGSTGLSPLAVLVAAVFWTWLWGTVGLLLATPLTVCVVVLGRHVPHLGFLSVMLSDTPALSPASRFYQRMVARDLDDASAILQEQVKGRTLLELYDTVMIPALALAEEDRHLGKLDPERQEFLFQNSRLLIEDLGDRCDELTGPDSPGGRPAPRPAPPRQPPSPADEFCVVCLPARDEVDELAGMMLAQLLNKRGITAAAMSCAALSGETNEAMERGKPLIACVVAVPPLGYMHTRYTCRRLRKQFPDLKIFAVILSYGDVAELKKRKPPILADELSTSLKESIAQVACMVPLRDDAPARAATVP